MIMCVRVSFFCILKFTEERSCIRIRIHQSEVRIRIRTKMSRIPNTAISSVCKSDFLLSDVMRRSDTFDHRLNMELDLLNFIWAPVCSCTHWLRHRNSPPPTAFGLIHEGAIGQPR
jgi:hypothetical protein